MKDEQNNSNEKNLNLLNKLRTKLKTTKIVKKIASLAIACSMSIAAVSCTSNCSSSSSSTASNGGTTSEQQSGSNTNVGKYSEILTNILTSQYYNHLLSEAEKDTSILSSGKFDPHPYGFYDDMGFDVEAIKNNEIFCRTQSFVRNKEPNNLYIATYIENSVGNYYQQYVLRYKLTDKEMEDYHMLHCIEDRKFYLEAVFLNSEISKVKEPEILGNAKIDKTAHEKMCESFERRKLDLADGEEFVDIILRSCSPSKGEFEIYLLPKMTGSNVAYSECNFADTYLEERASSIQMNGDVFMGPYSHGQFDYRENSPGNTLEPIKIYHPQSCNLFYYSRQFTSK